MAVSLTPVVHTTDAKPGGIGIITVVDGNTGHRVVWKGAAC